MELLYIMGTYISYISLGTSSGNVWFHMTLKLNVSTHFRWSRSWCSTRRRTWTSRTRTGRALSSKLATIFREHKSKLAAIIFNKHIHIKGTAPSSGLQTSINPTLLRSYFSNLASRWKKVKVKKWPILKKWKSKVNAVDVDGHTALIWAADKGNVEVANHLLSHPNIDPNLQVLKVVRRIYWAQILSLTWN